MILPDIMPFSNHPIEEYVNTIYQVFLDEVVKKNLTFLSLPVTFPYKPPHANMHRCFWHSISNKGQTNLEKDRIANTSRCERIPWLSCVIEHAMDKELIWCWEKPTRTSRGRQNYIHLYAIEANYLIVLRRKSNRFELVTAFARNQNKPQEERQKYPDPR